MLYNFALLGDPVSHSLSPQIHAKFFAKASLKGGYVCVHTPPEKLSENIQHLQALGFRGVNLTIPHKEAGLKLASEATDEATKIGACNTLIFEPDGKIIADNTDWIGFLSSLPQKVQQESKEVLMLGAGGSARAVMMALVKMDSQKIYLQVRQAQSSLAKAQNIQKDFPELNIQVVHSATEVKALKTLDLIINTTPLGMSGKDENQNPLDKQALESIKNANCYFYDLVYNPAETVFLKEAAQKGFKTQNGFGMLQLQAAQAFSLWTGVAVKQLL